MKHKIMLVMAGILLLALSAVVSAQDKSITIWITGGDNEATALSNASAAFTEETGIEVNVEAVGWSDAQSRYLTAINSGSGADMFAGGMSWGISFGGIGGLVDLKTEFGDDVQAVLDGNNPEFANAIVGVDGAVYGVPYNQDVFLMYYLPEALAGAGIENPPTTWEELAATLEALNEAGVGGAGMGWGNASWLSFQPFLAQAGGSWYTEDCSAAAINSEEGLAALEFYTSLYADYGVPQDASDASSLNTGSLSILFDGEWVAPGIDTSYPDLVGKWAVAPLPAGPAGNNATFIGGKMMGIFAYSPNVAESWQFLQWLQTPAAQEALVAENFSFSQMHVPPQTENTQFIQGAPSVNENVNAQLASTTAPPHCPGWEESNADVNLAIQAVLFEEGDFEEALASMEDTMNTNLEEYGG
jgi:multiple sugar transport system substrate-binding protein